MATLFDAYAGLRKASRMPTPFLPRPRVVRAPSAAASVTELETIYVRDPIYRAERRLNRKITTPYVLRTIPEMQAYGDAVLFRASQVYSRGGWPVQFKDGKTPGLASHQSGVILVPGPVRQITLLHELAHHLVGSEQEHNQTWLDAFVFLIDQEMGPDISRRLLDELQPPEVDSTNGTDTGWTANTQYGTLFP